MNKKGITSVCMAFAGGQGVHTKSQGTTFREGGLEKKVHMEKEGFSIEDRKGVKKEKIRGKQSNS